MSYSNIELENLLDETEADWVERKETFGDSEKCRQAVCAFCNDFPRHEKPGVLFVGVNDEGTPTGLEVSDQLLLALSDMARDGNILPLPTMTVQKKVLKGISVAVVEVHPSDGPPVRFKGKVWIRIGPRRAIANVQEERILSEKRRFKDLPFDARSNDSAKLEELNSTFFQEYLRQAIDRDVLAANGRSELEQLSSVKFISEPSSEHLTNLGVLISSRRPSDLISCSYVQFLKFEGATDTSPVIDEFEARGRLDEVIKQVEDKFHSHNSVSVRFADTPKETRTETIPHVAFQQIFRNAILHRTYEGTNAPVRVYWFSDRMEILSRRH